MSEQDYWTIPPLTHPLDSIITELRGLSRGGLQQQKEGDQEEVKGLKFISNKLSRLFDRNKKLKYSHISKILIQNFSSESNDSRNIKRRVYDAINVMVAAGLFEKNGDSLQRKQSQDLRKKIQKLKNELSSQYNQRQKIVNTKKAYLKSLNKKKDSISKLIERNKKLDKTIRRVKNASLVEIRESSRSIKVESNRDNSIIKIDIKKSQRIKAKGVTSRSQILQLQDYIDYL